MGPGGHGEERDERRRGSWTDGRELPEEAEEDEVDDEGERRRRQSREGGMEEDTRDEE